MEKDHQDALYVTYYLARFDKKALGSFDYSTWTEVFNDIAFRMNVQKHSVKNWRDEFAPLFPHRKGWHKRPMIPSRIELVELVKNLTKRKIRIVVFKIVNGKIRKLEEIKPTKSCNIY